MRLRALAPSLILLSCVHASACASKSAHSDRYYADSPAAEASYDAGPAALPTIEFAKDARDDAGYGGPAAVLAAPAPLTAAKPMSPEDAVEIGERPPETLETIGSDSIDQMLIFTGQLAVEVEFASTAKRIDAAVQLAVAAGGYVAQMTDTTLHLRVPSKQFRRVMAQIENLGTLRSRQVQAVDVSEEFNDLEVRLENLRATRARIEKLLAQAKGLSEVLTIEKELERVTAEIDRIEGRMRLLSSQAAFSTIAVGFSERPMERATELAGEETPPPMPPRTLRSSATWIHQVNIHSLMSID